MQWESPRLPVGAVTQPSDDAKQIKWYVKHTLIGLVPKIHTIYDIQKLYHLPNLSVEIVLYWKWRNAVQDIKLNSSQATFCSTRLFRTLEIPVLQPGSKLSWEIHKLRCTGSHQFRNSSPRRDWVWVRIYGSEETNCL